MISSTRHHRRLPLLYYLPLGFLVENLIEGRARMTRASFGIMWTIFIVNLLWEFFVKASELAQAVPSGLCADSAPSATLDRPRAA